MTDETPKCPDGEVFAFPASVQQRAFWFLHSLSPDVGTFNVPLRFEIEGNLDVAILRETLGEILGRHEALRTHFEEEDGELLQVVSPPRDAVCPLTDLGSLPTEQLQEELDRICRADAEMPFDLSSGPLVRMRILRFSESRHVFCFTAHHTVFDGWSINLLTDEIGAIYTAKRNGSSTGLEPLGLQYADYSVWQREFLEGPEVAKQTDFWMRKLEGMSEPALTTDHRRPAVKSWRGGVESIRLPDALAERVHALGARHGFTAFHMLLAAFKLLLVRYTGNDDISVGTPASGRTHAELDSIIGVFINPLVLRTDLSGDPSFLDACGRIRETVVESLENQDVPFESIVDRLQSSRDPGRNPLFQINFTYEGVFGKSAEFSGLRWHPISAPGAGVIFDLHLFVVESADGWKLSCEFSDDLFERSTILQMLKHLLLVLDQAVENPDRPVREIELLTEQEVQRITADWSGARHAHQHRGSVPERLEAAAAHFADRPALLSASGEVKYEELLTWVRASAGVLRHHGVTAGSRVACCLPQSIEAVVAVYAILWAGGSYVPMDPSDPVSRRLELLAESGASHLLVSDTALETGGWSGTVVQLPSRQQSGMLPALPREPVSQKAAAYVMFTSGSTGRPKGVEVPHRAILRLVAENDFLNISAEDVFLMAAPMSFDASTFEIHGSLLNGGSLVIPSPRPGLAELEESIRKYGVTTMWLTSGFFEVILDEKPEMLRGLKNLLAGGDVLSPHHVAKALELLPGTRLVNGYGPTENTTFTTCHTIRPEDLEAGSIPIGRPIRGTSVFILDEEGRPVPTGVPGTLYTGGDGLALGYVGDHVLTAERFTEHPVFGRLYNTGDRCRWNAEGNVIFIGRSDHQVKLRGFRIEPGEIEARLGGYPGASRCKVAVRGEGAGAKRLLAWVCAEQGFDPATASAWLGERLPKFMVPDRIIPVAEMPLTGNGKVAVARLPEAVPEVGSAMVAQQPTGETELRLAEIWTGLLSLQSIGRDDDFFETGGNSLAGLRMFARIQKEFGAALPLATLLKARTIRQLARAIEATTDVPSPELGGQLAEVQPQGDQPPLLAIHGGDGGILFYRELAERLPKDRPFFAIESPDLGRDEEIKVGTIEETAARYVAILRANRPSGPYLLAGYSYGGVVAYEMACQLVSEGEEVPFLALFDTINPAADIRPYALTERVSVYWNARQDLSLGERMLKLANRFAEGVNTHMRVKSESAAAQKSIHAAAHSELRAVMLREAHEAAMDSYRPGYFAGKMHVFRAAEVNDKFEVPDDYGWGHLVDSLVTIEVPGEHLTLFEEGNVSPLAEQFSRSVSEALSQKVDVP